MIGCGGGILCDGQALLLSVVVVFLRHWKLAFEFSMKQKASQSIFREKHRSSTVMYKMFRMFSAP